MGDSSASDFDKRADVNGQNTNTLCLFMGLECFIDFGAYLSIRILCKKIGRVFQVYGQNLEDC